MGNIEFRRAYDVRSKDYFGVVRSGTLLDHSMTTNHNVCGGRIDFLTCHPTRDRTTTCLSRANVL
jgi:hypothetical protein